MRQSKAPLRTPPLYFKWNDFLLWGLSFPLFWHYFALIIYNLKSIKDFKPPLRILIFNNNRDGGHLGRRANKGNRRYLSIAATLLLKIVLVLKSEFGLWIMKRRKQFFFSFFTVLWHPTLLSPCVKI